MTPAKKAQADDVPTHLSGQFASLQQRIDVANSSGNLDGLLARHVLGELPDFMWHVDPLSGPWLDQHAYRLADTSALAVLGYAVDYLSAAGTEVRSHLSTGLRRLMQRDPFPGDRLSFLHDVRILFGICLAAKAAKSEVPEAVEWLQGILAHPRLQPSDRFHELAQRHARAGLVGHKVELADLSSLRNGNELAVAYWMIRRGTASLVNSLTDLRMFQQQVMHAALRADSSHLTVPEAAFLLAAGNDVIKSTVDQMVLSRSHVGAVLRRFEPAMRRWRWDSNEVEHPIQWEVRSEREVQDILWIMLRSVFDDVVDEDTLRKFGHSSYRADFGLPQLGILIEAKYAYKGSDFKKIEQDVMVDCVGYLQNTEQYKEIIVFIYDESRSVEHHDLTVRTLMDLDAISDVIIVSRSGMLPTPIRTPRKRSGKASKS